MRPVTLTVAGMRSYRTQRTLDFSGRTLMAILGDTGSGKSSLLEALYGGLYGGSTWDDRGGLKAMIADGVQTLQIQLVFEARGQQYTVSRSTSVKNYPPSKHVFDGPGGEHLDGERAVNARIIGLVGLTGQEFLRVVILPQGRFGQLLQGTAGERTPILRGILGLGVLDRVRDAADRQATDLAAGLEPVVAARARLYPQPATVAATAASDKGEHTQSVERLRNVTTALRDLEVASRNVTATLPPISALLDACRLIDLAPVQAALADAATADAALSSQDGTLTTKAEALQKQDSDLKAELAAAHAAGLSTAALATMTTSLTYLATTLPALREQATAHAQEQAAIETAAAELDAGAEKTSLASAAAEACRFRVGELQTAAQAAQDEARQRSEHRAAVAAATAALMPQRAQLQAAAGSTLAAAQQLHAARGQRTQALTGHAETRGVLTQLQAANAAAHVAKQHQPGQSCPVCEQTLPATFTAPAIVGEQTLLDALEAAELAAAQASTTERQAERALDSEQQKLLTLTAAAAAAAASVTALLSEAPTIQAPDPAACAAAAQAAAGRLLDLPPTKTTTAAQLTKDVEALNAELAVLTGVSDADTLAAAAAGQATAGDGEQEHDTAVAALEAAQTELATLSTAAVRLDAEHRAAGTALDRRRTEHQAATSRTYQAAQALARDIQALPELISGPLVMSLGLTVADPGAALLAVDGLPDRLLADLHTLIETKQAALEELSNQRETLSGQIRTLDEERVTLREDRTDTVERPRAAGRRTAERAADTLTRLVSALSPLRENWPPLKDIVQAPALPDEPADAASGALNIDVEDAQLNAEVLTLRSRLTSVNAHAELLLAAATDAVTLSSSAASALLSTAGADSVDDLAEQLSQALLDLRHATTLAERAGSQVPIAEGLDVGIAALSYQLKVLRQIKDLLNPSAFPQYVVEQRQVALLRIASTLFGQLTRNAYGFGEDFMIVDRRTGQPRQPKTLSGGETFLASLALALALVEVSNRSGGQLDCLFLDEGFGSLDSSILGEALDVLRMQASGGRLVGVISHLHAVAAELDDVLVVTKAIEGSSFRWLDAEERDVYLLDEAAAGLLS